VASGDFERIFEALALSHVRYLVVGGVAVVLHGHARVTADLDLIVALEPENARAAMTALIGLGYRPRAPVDPLQFADPEVRQHWIDEKGLKVFSLWSPNFPGTEIDIFVKEPMPFVEMAGRAVRVTVGGSQLLVAGIEDIIRMKKAVGRPKDLDDVAELEAIAMLREKS
jgi:hypothetical protein